MPEKPGSTKRTIPRGLAKRYAKAMLNAALKANIAEQVSQESASLIGTFAANPAYKQFLLSPQTTVQDKKDVIESTLRARASDLLIQMLFLLIENKRIMLIDEIAQAYIDQYERHIGVIEVSVITAIELSEALTAQVQAKLDSLSDWKVRINKVVDPSIIGGVILIMDDKTIDGSIRHEIETMKRGLAEISAT